MMLLLSFSRHPRQSWQCCSFSLLFLSQAFRVFERMARQDDEKRRRELEAKLRKKEEEEEAAAAAERVKLCPAAQEIEVETTEHIPAPDAGGAAGTQESAAAQGAAAPSPVSAEPSGAAAPAQLPM